MRMLIKPLQIKHFKNVTPMSIQIEHFILIIDQIIFEI